jgi:hypothetical protein
MVIFTRYVTLLPAPLANLENGRASLQILAGYALMLQEPSERHQRSIRIVDRIEPIRAVSGGRARFLAILQH